MNEAQNNELANVLIDIYATLEMIIHSSDPKQEAEYQKGLITAKLEAMGLL